MPAPAVEPEPYTTSDPHPEERAFVDARLDYSPETFGRFLELVGSVRENAAAMTGLEVADIPLLEVALEWERKHGARGTVVSKLAGKLDTLRRGRVRHVEPRRAEPRLSPQLEQVIERQRTEAPPIPLSPNGQARAEAAAAKLTAQAAALTKLAATLPGYVAACEAEELCRSLGLVVVLADLAGRS